jgi:protein-disulfide isomerase
VSVTEQPESKAARATSELQRKLRLSQRFNLALGALVVFLVVVVATQQAGGGGVTSAATVPATATATATSQTLAVQVARNQAEDPMAWGDINAPVLMVEWTDFRCPYCAVFSTQTLPTILKDYVDAGKVRLEVHDAALFGDQSVDAAVAARAAGAQGKYREYMLALYAAAPTSGHPDLPEAKLVTFAEQAGVPDIAAFTAALKDSATRKQVTDGTAAAQKIGVNSVPFFVVGNQVVNGAQPLLNFTSAIESELAKK